MTRAKEVQEIYDHYRKYHPRKPSVVPAVDRMKIVMRLKEGLSTSDLISAIDGCHHSPYHCGENKSGTRYQTLDLILRNSDQVTKFIEIEERYQEKQDEAPAELPEGAVPVPPRKAVKTPDGSKFVGRYGGYFIPKRGIWEYVDERYRETRKVYP